ncbi:MAG TPA: DNA primase, partial [Armatimonadetes bacterium]|nr:DNA primase [Armatimonadota bacterium]
MSIAEETIEAIRARADIAAVVSQYVTLKRRGRNLVGLCPFHTEKTPSFSVFPERQSWHCFGCGEGGNVFTFLMRIDHLTFPEAVERLGQQVGIPVERSRENAARRSLRQQILEANQAAAEFFA